MAFIVELTSESQFKTEILDTPGTLQVIEVYQSWCGPCKAVQSTFKRLYFDLNDRPLKFYAVAAERLPMLKDYVGKCIPVFLFFKDGKQLERVVGVQAPALNRLVMEHSAVKAAAGA
ncbi:hypothetical protein GPECTOR_14g244 [Gonium pectorale]|uniref:Thioredoxin domain-containing protein n=1 Tax=Gonium pectorale TaxID=33097 RepID=A0A150GMP6_GONPE|nr:hypothetical protein GPECTOR_14g244 [Gonium pectorale]|eukprot:KXZ51002.1 hypothetical protein GPECTOR_14g244 [Gonium pectorale]